MLHDYSYIKPNKNRENMKIKDLKPLTKNGEKKSLEKLKRELAQKTEGSNLTKKRKKRKHLRSISKKSRRNNKSK